MKNRSDPPEDLAALQEKLAGFGESSLRKTYYPELQRRLEELERFKAFIDHSNDAIFLVEVPAGSIVDVNDSATQQMGWSLAEFLESSLLDFFDLESQIALDLIRNSPEQEGERALTFTELRRKDGTRFPAELTLNRMSFRERAYVLAVARDISERKKAEEALRQNQDYLKNVIDNIPAMVFAKDASDLSYVTFNKAGEDLLGFSREELLGKSDFDFFPREQAEFFIKKDRLTLEKGELVEIPEETIKTRSGKDIILHTKKIPLLDEQGRARYLLGISEDITEKKHLEEQLLQSQKMEAIGQLAGGVAHDFNNILMVIMGYGTMLTADDALAIQHKEKVERIIEAADKAAQLTSSLLAFSRKQVMKLRTENLNDIVLHVQKFLVRIIGEDVRLKSVLSGGYLFARVDSGQIEQVLINLATNARDAMPKGGLLTLETSQQMIDELFIEANNFGEPGRYGVISVSDTGTGMDEQTRIRIFEPFFTTKEPGKGTGLGMSIVYGIIKQHNGFINVYSELHLGTTFRIYLPLAGPEAVNETEHAGKDLPRGGTETILVAEDESALRELLQNVLTGYGYQVILAEDGLDAVEKYQQEPGRISLVLMDMIMPRMSGKEACDAIRKIDPEARVVYTSGYTADIIKTRDVLEEGTELIMKPVHPLELLRRVREILDK
jgi:two-component system, cell cycle sensor histidine kinase and response regulator CckA